MDNLANTLDGPKMAFVPLVDDDGNPNGHTLYIAQARADDVDRPLKIRGSTRIMNETGHMIVTWTEEQDDEIVAMIQAKMDAGYSFFIVKSRAFGMLPPTKTELTSMRKQKKALLDSRTVEIKDATLNSLVEAGKVGLTADRVGGEIETEKLIDSKEPGAAKKAAASDTVAIPPRKGG